MSGQRLCPWAARATAALAGSKGWAVTLLHDLALGDIQAIGKVAGGDPIVTTQSKAGDPQKTSDLRKAIGLENEAVISVIGQSVMPKDLLQGLGCSRNLKHPAKQHSISTLRRLRI